MAPDFISAKQGGIIRLELAVWGSGGDIAGRYTDVRLSYRLVGERDYKTAGIRVISSDSRRRVLEARIAPLDGAQGEIEYFVELKLDGHYSRFDGSKRIQIALRQDVLGSPHGTRFLAA